MTEFTASHTYDSGAPLAGRSVLVTRTREQAHALVEPLEALGAEVLAMPVLETVDPEGWDLLDAAIVNLPSYDWVVFTSTNGIDRFLRRFKAAGGTREAILGAKFAAVGSATAEKLRRHGLPPALVPDDFRAEGLVAEFRALGVENCRRVLIPRALEAREILPEALREMGCEVDVVPVYRTAAADPDPAVIERLLARSVDVVTFTSGAIAAAFIAAVSSAGLSAEDATRGVLIASIGPVTSDALRALGYAVDIEAAESTMGSLVDAIAVFYASDVVAPGVGEEPQPQRR